MKEIGGYLELDRLSNKNYHKNAISLNTGRNAFVYLARAKKIKKVYIPYYLCASVSNVCKRENIDFEYYNIDKNFFPVFNKSLNSNEYLYIVNCFGQLQKKEILFYKKQFGNIILDNVQAFFDSPIKGVDTIYSCRKFFGVPDGAYLVSDACHLDFPTDTSIERMHHILGRLDSGSASKYFADFQTSEESLNTLPVCYMSKLTHALLSNIDYEAVYKKRNENWETLHKSLSKINPLFLKKPRGPYMYPFYCANGEAVRKALISKKIYIPMLWSNVLQLDDCVIEKDFAVNILPLPVDQRYNKEDMRQIVEILKINL